MVLNEILRQSSVKENRSKLPCENLTDVYPTIYST